MKLLLTLLTALFTLSLVGAVTFNNVQTANSVNTGDVINQGAFAFVVDSTSLQGGAVLKVNGNTLILNPGQKIHFDVYDIVSSKGVNGPDVTFTKTAAVNPQPKPQNTNDNAALEINQVAVDMFNKNTNNAFKDFNFKTVTKKDQFIVSAWKKIKTPSSSKDGIESYTFLRGIVMYLDKNTGKTTSYFSTN